MSVLLVAWWGWSYWWTTKLGWNVSEQEYGGLSVLCGRVLVTEQHFRNYVEKADNSPHLAIGSYPSDVHRDLDDSWFGYINDRMTTRLYFPILIPIGLTTMLSYLAWNRRIPVQFSLRTLLIATTLFAILLGLIVWLDK